MDSLDVETAMEQRDSEEELYKKIVAGADFTELVSKDSNPIRTPKYTYYENGQIESEAYYKDDKLDGKQTEWYENGQIELEGNYKNGERDGNFTAWDENGQIEFEATFKDGECISGVC